jgi:tetratricopeptide (TPR) repeat protein
VKRNSLSVLFFVLLAALAAPASSSQPVNAAELMAWLASGVRCDRLVRIVEEHGLAGTFGKEQIQQLKSAGSDDNLIRALTAARAPDNHKPTNNEISAFLLKAAADAQAQRFHEAELALRQALRSDPQNPALHFALGTMLRQQENWEDAFDQISVAAHLMPDLPENHSALAYIFYRLDDGPNAIAEARTALSIDPQNAEAYQILGLGLYSNGQYAPAVHALLESLARDQKNSDTYYDLGIALHAAGNLTARPFA